MRKERIEILGEIDRLNEYRCSECAVGLSNSAKAVCDCEADIEIRLLGERLLGLVNKRESDKLLESLDGLGAFTVDKYKKLKDAEVPDDEISRRLRIGPKTLVSWKRSNKLRGYLRGEKKNG